MKKRLQWFGCYVAYKIYNWLPPADNHQSLWGRFQMWLLGFGGAYAHSETFADFCEHVSFNR